jgi:hypothetical protein
MGDCFKDSVSHVANCCAANQWFIEESSTFSDIGQLRLDVPRELLEASLNACLNLLCGV